MPMIGMTLEEVRGFANQLRSKADQIDQLTGELTSALGGTTWVGNDRTQFENDWNSNYVTALKNVAEGLRGAAQRADQNAMDQEGVSNA